MYKHITLKQANSAIQRWKALTEAERLDIIRTQNLNHVDDLIRRRKECYAAVIVNSNEDERFWIHFHHDGTVEFKTIKIDMKAIAKQIESMADVS